MSEIFTCGIDLGTTFCCCGWKKDGVTDILSYATSNRTIPSYVCFLSEKDFIVGESAKNKLQNLPQRTVYDVKRLIGKKINDPGVQEDRNHYAYEIDGDENRNAIVNITIDGTTTPFTPEKISSIILKHITEELCDKNNLKKDQKMYAVITVPAYFKDSQRRATIEAGRLAGLNVLRVINEPTAAAVAYGFQYLNDENKSKESKKRILVYDFGGGTFDVSIIEVENNEINVLATGGDDHLGGEDITNNLLNYYINKLKDESGIDISNNVKRLNRLKRECDELKLSLSTMHDSDISCDLFEDNDIDSTLSRSEFVDINRDLFNKTIEIVRSTLNDGNLSKESIDDIVLIGGSSKIPQVEELLTAEFPGAKINKDINPEEAVAFGAAILADDLCQGASEKLYDNGCLALVNENENIICYLNDIPPPQYVLDAMYQSAPQVNDDDDDDLNLPVEADSEPEEPSSSMNQPNTKSSVIQPRVYSNEEEEEEEEEEDDDDDELPIPRNIEETVIVDLPETASSSNIEPPPPPPPQQQSPPSFPPAPQLNDSDNNNVLLKPEAPTSPIDTSEEYLPISADLPISEIIVETVPVELPKYINNAKPKSTSMKSPLPTKPKKAKKTKQSTPIKKVKNSPFTAPSPQIKNKKNIVKNNSNDSNNNSFNSSLSSKPSTSSSKLSTSSSKPSTSSKSKNHIKINDVLSHGICKSTYSEDHHKILETIVSKNTKLPCSKESRPYKTAKNNQKFIKFGYYESDDCVLERAHKIRQCKIDNIPPHRRDEIEFVHELYINENQIINVRIREKSNKMPDITMTIVK